MPEAISTEDRDVAMILAAVELTKHVEFAGDTGSAAKLAITYKTLYAAIHEAWRTTPTG